MLDWGAGSHWHGNGFSLGGEDRCASALHVLQHCVHRWVTVGFVFLQTAVDDFLNALGQRPLDSGEIEWRRGFVEVLDQINYKLRGHSWPKAAVHVNVYSTAGNDPKQTVAT